MATRPKTKVVRRRFAGKQPANPEHNKLQETFRAHMLMRRHTIMISDQELSIAHSAVTMMIEDLDPFVQNNYATACSLHRLLASELESRGFKGPLHTVPGIDKGDCARQAQAARRVRRPAEKTRRSNMDLAELAEIAIPSAGVRTKSAARRKLR